MTNRCNQFDGDERHPRPCSSDQDDPDRDDSTNIRSGGSRSHQPRRRPRRRMQCRIQISQERGRNGRGVKGAEVWSSHGPTPKTQRPQRASRDFRLVSQPSSIGFEPGSPARRPWPRPSGVEVHFLLDESDMIPTYGSHVVYFRRRSGSCIRKWTSRITTPSHDLSSFNILSFIPRRVNEDGRIYFNPLCGLGQALLRDGRRRLRVTSGLLFGRIAPASRAIDGRGTTRRLIAFTGGPRD